MALKLLVHRVPEGAEAPPPGVAPEELVLDQDQVAIGRDPASDVLLEDKLVSRQHAKIWREGQAYFLQDLDSTQGTKLNDKPVKPGNAAPLRNGDVVKVPGYLITFLTWAADGGKGVPEKTSFVAKEVLRGAMKTLGEGAPVLRVLTSGKRLELQPGQEVLIGRDPDACQLVIDAERVSRKHAKVRRDWGGVTLFDLGSTNGVKLNGKRIARDAKLRDRDEIEIGGVKILLIDPASVRDEHVAVPMVSEPPRGDGAEPAVVVNEPGAEVIPPPDEIGTRIIPPGGDEPASPGGFARAPDLPPPPPPGIDEPGTQPLPVKAAQVEQAARARDLERGDARARALAAAGKAKIVATRALESWQVALMIGIGLAALALLLGLIFG